MISVRPPVAVLPAAGMADRFRYGVGPEPRLYQASRDFAPPSAALGKTAVCGDCGRPYLISDGHSCRKAATS